MGLVHTDINLKRSWGVDEGSFWDIKMLCSHNDGAVLEYFSRISLPLDVTLRLCCQRASDWLEQRRHSLRASVTPHAFPPCSGWCLRKDGGRRSGWSGYPERRGRGTAENTAKKGRHLVRLELKPFQRCCVAVGCLRRGCQRHEG